MSIAKNELNNDNIKVKDNYRLTIEKQIIEQHYRKLDSLYSIKDLKMNEYKVHFDSTINTIQGKIDKDDSLTFEAIKIAKDDSELLEVDSIYNELIKKHL